MVAVSKQLAWARQLQALAQTGLAYEDTSAYDRERYELVRRIAAEMLVADDADALEALLADEVGHATPKLGVRGAVFRDDRILLVRERSGGWTLPGGWVDVGETPSEAVVREVREESGYDTRAVKLIELYDRDCRRHPPSLWHIWKACFLCELVDDVQHAIGHDIDGSEFFAHDALPELDLLRTPAESVERFFAHRNHPEWPTDFD